MRRGAAWYWPHLAAFAIGTGWDWLTTVYTRKVADDSLAAIPTVAALTAFWAVAVPLVAERRYLGPALIAGAAFGTWLGLLWPERIVR